uniref:Zinc finger CCCH-type with G patch domain-containing protein n=1 Tax=Echinostoma caproni TaxID=27848 RepID=A0A183AGY2_9TREM
LDVQLQAQDSVDRSDLLALRQDLVELIALQEEQFLAERKGELLRDVQKQLFGTCSEGASSSNSSEKASVVPTTVTDELKQILIGQRCSIGGWTANGRFVRQNAVICDIVDEASDPKAQIASSSEVMSGRVRVFLTHPTRTTDLPCAQFMTDGFCRRGIRCPWSHGKIVSSEDIEEWDELDPSLYLNEGQPCLVKEQPHSTRPSIWRHAHLLHTDLESENCVIQWGHKYVPQSSKEMNKSGCPRSGLVRRDSYDHLEDAVASVPLHAVWPLSADSQVENREQSLMGDEIVSTDSDVSSSDESDNGDGNESTSPVRSVISEQISKAKEGQLLSSILPQKSFCVVQSGHAIWINESRVKNSAVVSHAHRSSKVIFVSGGVLSPEDVLRARPYSDPIQLSESDQTKYVSQLGMWETHTRGIGSRLLAKMGYSGKGGLGSGGSGRPFPVALLLEKFQILPQGWNTRPSLDRLLRTAECPKQRKRVHRLDPDMNTSTKQKDPAWQPYLFQFLNNALQRSDVEVSESDTTASGSQTKPQTSSKLVRDEPVDPSSGEFRVQLFRTHEDINRIKHQIRRARESIERNRGHDRVIVKQAEERLSVLQTQLDRLRAREQNLQQCKEKQTTEKKLRIF